MKRFFDIVHTLPILLDVKTKHYTWDELFEVSEALWYEKAEQRDRRANYYHEQLKTVLSAKDAYENNQDFAIVEEVTLSYQGGHLHRTFDLFDVFEAFDLPLIENCFDHPQQMLDVLLAAYFKSPYGLTLEETKFDDLFEYCVEQTEQLMDFFGDQYEDIFDAFFVYERGEEDNEDEWYME
jgi:hypothetical protein